MLALTFGNKSVKPTPPQPRSSIAHVVRGRPTQSPIANSSWVMEITLGVATPSGNRGPRNQSRPVRVAVDLVLVEKRNTLGFLEFFR
jgi:hypothetical protein